MKRRAATTAFLMVSAVAVVAFYQIQWRPKLEDNAAHRARPHAVLDRAVSAVELYKLEKGRYPSSDEGLDAVVAAGLLPAPPVDRWGRRLNYRYPSSRPGVPFELWSFGADGKEGGTGEDRDLGNWNDDA